LILSFTSSLTTIVGIYFTLVAENHRWWWLSYWMGASPGFYMFLYSLHYLVSNLHITAFWSVVLYIGYSFILSSFVFVMTGSVGYLSALWFVRTIYSQVKLD